MEKNRKIPWSVTILLLTVLLIVGVLHSSFQAQAAISGVVSTQSGSLRVRSTPNGTQIGSVGKGSTVSIVEETGDGWYKIVYGNGYGYVSKQYITVTSVDNDYKSQLIAAGFPESYCDALCLLHEQYPNWEFVPWYTGLNWDDVLNAESAVGKNTIQSSSISSYKSIEQGAYDLGKNKWVSYDSGGWVTASKELVAYYLDPRNFLDPYYVFMFMDQSYDPAKQTEESLKKLVEGTFLAGEGYSTMIMNAAASSGVNPYVLTSMILIEQGTKGTGNSISGTVKGYEGYYNFFNVGAYATSKMTAVQRGLWYARGGDNGATTYNRPWNSKEAAIIGGAIYYGSNYVNKGQNTLYLKKFNVQGSELYSHQYMTNVQGAASEAFQVARAYNKIADGSMKFVIPIYNNMPDGACAKPTGNGDCVNYLKSLSVDGMVLSPQFNIYTQTYSLIVDNSVTSINVNAQAYQSTASVSGNVGVVALNDGMNTLQIVVTAQNGISRVYTINVYRNSSAGVTPPAGVQPPAEVQPPVDSTVPDGTAPDNTAPDNTMPDNTTPDSTMTGETSVTLSSDYKEITGMENLVLKIPEGVKGTKMLSSITVTNGSATVVSQDGNSGSGVVGTGMQLVIHDTAGTKIKTYTIAVEGDLSGDGKITVIDLLRLQKAILGNTSLSEAEQVAGDMNNNEGINVLDLLKLQKKILNN